MTSLPKKRTTIIDLEKVLAYQHDETIFRFIDCFDMPFEEAADIFREMKLLLALMANYPEEYIFAHEPLWVIDEMWHTFLMYSLDYQKFCTNHFGVMIHHGPTKRADKIKMIEDLKNNPKETEENLTPVVRNLYHLIYEYLGRETLVKWIHGYGKKYTIEHMNIIRKPIQ